MRCSTITALAGLAAVAGYGVTEKALGKAAGQGAVKLDPGEWEVTSEVTKVSGDRLPPTMLTAMRGHKQIAHRCIAPEQASRPFDMPGGITEGCDHSNFAMAGGRISGTIVCRAEKGETATVSMTMSGRFKARSYQTVMSMKTVNSAGTMTMETRSSARWVGACAKGEKE